MSTTTQTGITPRYDLRTLLRISRDDVFFHLNVHQVGRIEKFYPEDQTADVSLPIQRIIEGKNVALPVLPKCPVMFLTGGATGYITMPINTGDTCLVMFNDRDLDSWWTTGSSSAPKSRRAHDMSDGLVLVGFRHKGNALSNYSSTNIELSNLGSIVSLGTKVQIANEATSMKTVLDNLVNVLTAWIDTRGDSPNPATVTALNGIKTQIASLLET